MLNSLLRCECDETVQLPSFIFIYLFIFLLINLLIISRGRSRGLRSITNIVDVYMEKKKEKSIVLLHKYKLLIYDVVFFSYETRVRVNTSRVSDSDYIRQNCTLQFDSTLDNCKHTMYDKTQRDTCLDQF